MTYSHFMRNLEARGMFRIRPSLEAIQKVLRALGNPQERYPTIHIAGTNGKGSVAAALESVLRASGYRTGLYTSPHLMDLRERVAINGAPMVQGFTTVAQQVLDAEKRAKSPLTYFELVTAIAFQSFAAKKVDIAIIESGMGGYWDATNVIRSPLLSIISSIGLDHTQWLGITEYSIATQKAGVIKQGGCVISGVRGEGRRAIAKKALKMKASLIQIDTDFSAEPLTASWRTRIQVLSFLYRGSRREIVPFGLLGNHQVENAAVALTALYKLKEVGYRITAASRESGLRDITWPGRIELIRLPNSAPILLDGAHNPPAMSRLLQTIQGSSFKNAQKTFVFSAFKDKDYSAMGAMITPLAAEVCLTELPKPRGAARSELRTAFDKVAGPVRDFAEPFQALKAAIQDTPKDGLIIVTGSLSLVGMILGRLSAIRPGYLLHV